MNTHEQIAEHVARTSAPTTTVSDLARQGDVVLTRVGEIASLPHGPTPPGGVMIAAGKHGEHRLVGPKVAWLEGGKVSIDGTAILAHTDVPQDRHGAVQFGPGTWAYTGCRELGLDEVIQKVQD